MSDDARFVQVAQAFGLVDGPRASQVLEAFRASGSDEPAAQLLVQAKLMTEDGASRVLAAVQAASAAPAAPSKTASGPVPRSPGKGTAKAAVPPAPSKTASGPLPRAGQQARAAPPGAGSGERSRAKPSPAPPPAPPDLEIPGSSDHLEVPRSSDGLVVPTAIELANPAAALEGSADQDPADDGEPAAAAALTVPEAPGGARPVQWPVVLGVLGLLLVLASGALTATRRPSDAAEAVRKALADHAVEERARRSQD